MTVRLSTSSPNLIAAARFGAELQRVMRKRQVGQHVVKASAGVSRAAVVEWQHGRNLPTLADGLAILRGEMLRIGAVSKQQVGKALTMLEDARAPEIVAVDALALHRESVAAMCASCEPGGYCRTPACDLRLVSPLSLETHRADAIGIAVKPEGGHTPEVNARRAASNRALWAGRSQEERQARSATALAAKAAMSPEAKAAMGRRIGAANAAHSRARRAAKAAVA